MTNLAIIFKLEAQQGIYIHSEEEAEIILPSESGTFLVEDFSKTYVVNGEPAVSVITPVIAIPFHGPFWKASCYFWKVLLSKNFTDMFVRFIVFNEIPY